MPIVLSLTHPHGLGGRQTRTLARGSLTIGRAAGNDWVLPDPDRHLSKTHCSLAFEDGHCVLTDLSMNGVFHNGARTPIGREKSVRLTDGDEFRLGEYVVSVAEIAAAAEDEPDDRDDPFAAPPPKAATGGARRDPFAHPAATDLLGDPLDAPFEPPPPLAAPRGRLGGGRGREDPFDRADEAARRPADPLDDMFRGIEPAESWQGPSQPDDVEGPAQAFWAPPVRPAAADDFDFDALLGEPEPPPVAATPAAPPPRPEPAVAAAPAPPSGAKTAAAALAAFLEGAGVPDLAVGGQDPEAALRAAGEVLRGMVEGLRDVLMSRSAVKSEFRVERTMLRARDNNALKFSVTPEEALAALLLAGRPGYLPPLRATREAFDDLRTHEMAVMAGVQTALMGLLRRFAPATLEQRLQPGMLDAVLPLARRARTWELFCATYAEIAREAEDDFHSVFGREFARAYDAQARGS